jgi:hypothetical protein
MSRNVWILQLFDGEELLARHCFRHKRDAVSKGVQGILKDLYHEGYLPGPEGATFEDWLDSEWTRGKFETRQVWYGNDSDLMMELEREILR